MENDISADTGSGALRLSIPCLIAEVRPASTALRNYLQHHGLSEAELSACELAIVEALNNAIQYVAPGKRNQPVGLDAFCTRDAVLFQITDHTGGFVLPERIELPSFDAERGRGLFLIRSAMHEVRYECAPQGNCLTLQMRRQTV
jgi:anti-sigma regulatory factor (Ser/Thr protein kinase)